METFLFGQGFFRVDQSPTRLEGMETEFPQVVDPLIHGLRPALRGWKQYLCQGKVESLSRSPTRLEGMETMSISFRSFPDSSLRPALRGWKRKLRKRSASEREPVSDPP